jgi:hypothetical protein
LGIKQNIRNEKKNKWCGGIYLSVPNRNIICCIRNPHSHGGGEENHVCDWMEIGKIVCDTVSCLKISKSKECKKKKKD